MYPAAVSLSLLPTSPPHLSSRLPAYSLGRILPDPSPWKSSTSSAADQRWERPAAASGLQTPPGDGHEIDMGTTYQPPALASYEDRRYGPSRQSTYSSQLLSEAERKRTILSEISRSSTLGSSRDYSPGGSKHESSSHSHTLDHDYDIRNIPGTSSVPALTAEPYTRLEPPVIRLQPIPQQQQQQQQQRQTPHRPEGIALLSGTTATRRQSQPSLGLECASAARPSTPTDPKQTIVITDQDSAAMTTHSLEVPKCICPQGGNLADFIASMACLFWFESPMVYQLADNIDMIPPNVRIPRLCAHATPTLNFKMWLNRMLATTQVTVNVPLVALLFIYRLRSLNAMVRGKPGSEFRLLTVALMLGNKYLDDNTYTNKTWSDVSGLNVKEIHVMEVEFLSNMRYSLLVSKPEWEAWLVKLAKLCKYYDRASTAVASPTASSPQHPLMSASLSPTRAQHGGHSFTGVVSPEAGVGMGAPQQPWTAPFPGAEAVSPLAGKSSIRSGFGKRAHEDDATEPPPKRIIRPTQPVPAALPPPPALQGTHPSTAMPVPTTAAFNLSGVAGSGSEAMRLPVPHLSLNTGAAQMAAAAAPNANAFHLTPLQALPPPLAHGVRAMSTVYSSGNGGVSGAAAGAIGVPVTAPAPANSGFMPQLPQMGTGGSGLAGAPATTMALATGGGITPTGYAASAFGTPTKRTSPMSALTPGGGSGYAVAATSSPLTDSFPQMAGVRTPISHSPSIYLQQRPSPYRPIRNVHMLLNPPSQGGMQDYQPAGAVLIPPTQMYYQPLGRRHDLRTGIVPEFQFQDMPFGGAVPHGTILAPGQVMQQMQLQHPQQHPQQHLHPHSQAYPPF